MTYGKHTFFVVELYKLTSNRAKLYGVRKPLEIKTVGQ